MMRFETRSTSKTQDNGFELKIAGSDAAGGRDRQVHRRHDLEQQSIEVKRVDAGRKDAAILGKIMDISASGVRIRTSRADVRPTARSASASSCRPTPASARSSIRPAPRPSRSEWTGWMAVARVSPVGGGDEVDVAGRLIDMDEMDRGMLGLYLDPADRRVTRRGCL